MFSCENDKIFKSTFFIEHFRWLHLVKLVPNFWNQQNFSSIDCTWYHGLPLHCDKILVKHDVHRKIFVVESIHIVIRSSKHLNKIKILSQWYVLNHRSFPTFTEWVVLWKCFLNDLSVKNTFLFNFYKKKIVWEFDVRSHVTQDLLVTQDTLLF